MTQDRVRLLRLARLLASFASLQGATQIASGLAGVLAVRVLPITGFAIYAIATSVQTSINVLSDIGVTAVVLSRAGQYHTDRERLAVLAETARRFRLRLSIPAILVAGPLLYLSLAGARPSASLCMGILVLVGISLLFQIRSSIDGALLLALLHSDAQLGAQLIASLLRLLGIAALLTIVPHYMTALVINCGASAVQAYLARRSLNRYLPATRMTSTEDREALTRFVKQQFPNAIHFAFSTQITIWLISVLSSATVVANVGALGRLTGLIVLFQSGMMTLVAPRVARLSDPKLLVRRYLQVLGFASVLSTLGILASLLVPGPLLWVIGPKYSGLGPYLPIAMASAIAYLVSSTFYGLNSARAWVISPLVAIPFSLATQALAVWRLDVSNTRGALLFGFITTLPPVVMGAFLSWKHLRELLRPTEFQAAGVAR